MKRQVENEEEIDLINDLKRRVTKFKSRLIQKNSLEEKILEALTPEVLLCDTTFDNQTTARLRRLADMGLSAAFFYVDTSSQILVCRGKTKVASSGNMIMVMEWHKRLTKINGASIAFYRRCKTALKRAVQTYLESDLFKGFSFTTSFHDPNDPYAASNDPDFIGKLEW